MIINTNIFAIVFGINKLSDNWLKKKKSFKRFIALIFNLCI